MHPHEYSKLKAAKGAKPPDSGPLERDSDLDRVTSFLAWCRRIGVSPATGRRLLSSGEGPRITRLSARRIGVRERDHVAWLDARSNTAA
jgi:hypothetical protein